MSHDADQENQDGPVHGRKDRDDAGIPPWAKLAATVVGTTVTTIVFLMGYMNREYVSRVEYTAHSVQQAVDMERLAQTQRAYAVAEVTTGQGITELKVDVAEIKGDVAWLRDYLDLSRPPPKKRKNGGGG